jgi:hypothetical protein
MTDGSKASAREIAEFFDKIAPIRVTQRSPHRGSRSDFQWEHDLFGKPEPTFPDHALGNKQKGVRLV